MIYTPSGIQPEKKEKRKKKCRLLHRGWNWRALWKMKAGAQKEEHLFSVLNRGLKFDVIGRESKIITAGITVETGRGTEGSKRAFIKIQLDKNNKLYYSAVLYNDSNFQ